MSEVEEIKKLDEASLQNSWVFVEDCDIDGPENKYYLNCSTEPITELTDTVDKNDLETDSDGISIISDSDEAKEIVTDVKDTTLISERDDVKNDDIKIDDSKVDDYPNTTWRFYIFALGCLLLAILLPMLFNYIIYQNNNLQEVSNNVLEDYLENDLIESEQLINVNIEISNETQNFKTESKSKVAINNLNISEIKEVEVINSHKNVKDKSFKDKKIKDGKHKEKIKDVKIKEKFKENVKEVKKSNKIKKDDFKDDKSRKIKGDKKFKYENIKDKDNKIKNTKKDFKTKNYEKLNVKENKYDKIKKSNEDNFKYDRKINGKKSFSEERKKEKNIKPYIKTDKNGNYKKTTKTDKVKINNNNNLRWKLDEYYFSSRIDKRKIFNTRTKEQFYVMEEQYSSYFKRVIF